MKKSDYNKKLFTLISILASIFVYTGAVAIYFYANGWRLDPVGQLLVRTGVLTVESDPFLANLYVNGEQKGRTPKSVSLSVGKHTISVYRSGYIEWKKEIEIKQEKSTPIFPWLVREDIVKENITTLQGKEYVKSWVNESNHHIYFLTKQYLDVRDIYRYDIYRYDINTSFWDLNSNPRSILTFDYEKKEPEIQLLLSPGGILGVLTIKDDKSTKQYILDSNKSSTLESLTELKLSAFSSYKMTWARNNQYLMFESSTDLISFDIQKETRYLLIKKEKDTQYIWETDEQGFFYLIENNLENEDEKIYSYLLVQELMDGSSAKVLVDSLYFQKEKKYIEMYKEETGGGKYAPFTNSPQSTKSVGAIKSFRVNQSSKGIYINTETSSYWYNIATKKYYLISPYSAQLIQFSPDGDKLIFLDEKGYSVFTFNKEDGDHTVEIGSKEIMGLGSKVTSVNWLSNSSYIWYVKDNSMYISDQDGENKVKLLSDIDTLKYFVITVARDKVITLSLGEKTVELPQDILIDSYLIH